MVDICYSSLGKRSLDRCWYRFVGSRLRASSIPRSVYPSDSLSGLDSPSRTSLILMSSHFSSSPFTIVHTKHIEDTRHYRGWKGFYLTIDICDSHYNAGFLKFDLWFQTIVNTYHAPEVVHIFSWISCKYTICLQAWCSDHSLTHPNLKLYSIRWIPIQYYIQLRVLQRWKRRGKTSNH